MAHVMVLSQSRFSVAIDESYPIDFMILNRCNVHCRWNFATEPPRPTLTDEEVEIWPETRCLLLQ
jgi:hypothetical protein